MATEYTTGKNTDNCFLTDGKRLMTKKGSLDFLLLIYYIESRRRLPTTTQMNLTGNIRHTVTAACNTLYDNSLPL